MSINASVTDLEGNKSNLFLRYDALEPATRNLICYLFPSSSNLDLTAAEEEPPGFSSPNHKWSVREWSDYLILSALKLKIKHPGSILSAKLAVFWALSENKEEGTTKKNNFLPRPPRKFATYFGTLAALKTKIITWTE